MIYKIIEQLNQHSYIKITQKDLTRLLELCTTHEEHNTVISDFIRILQINSTIIVQEKTVKGEILLRKFDSVESAHEFVSKRIEIYDKMWDGCGCKVDYYS